MSFVFFGPVFQVLHFQSTLMCKVCILDDAWKLLVTARVSLLGEPGAVYL